MRIEEIEVGGEYVDGRGEKWRVIAMETRDDGTVKLFSRPLGVYAEKEGVGVASLLGPDDVRAWTIALPAGVKMTGDPFGKLWAGATNHAAPKSDDVAVTVDGLIDTAIEMNALRRKLAKRDHAFNGLYGKLHQQIAERESAAFAEGQRECLVDVAGVVAKRAEAIEKFRTSGDHVKVLELLAALPDDARRAYDLGCAIKTAEIKRDNDALVEKLRKVNPHDPASTNDGANAVPRGSAASMAYRVGVAVGYTALHHHALDAAEGTLHETDFKDGEQYATTRPSPAGSAPTRWHVRVFEKAGELGPAALVEFRTQHRLSLEAFNADKWRAVHLGPSLPAPKPNMNAGGACDTATGFVKITRDEALQLGGWPS